MHSQNFTYWKKLCISFFLLLPSIVALGQRLEVNGKVIDSSDQSGIFGATAQVKGGMIGSITDVNGNFTVSAKPSDILVISSIGYQSKEIVLGEKDNYVISLRPSQHSLNELIVTGYTTQRKKDITGAVAVVNMDNLIKQPVGQLTNQLQGQASGVSILSSGQPGQEPRVTIRGLNTFGNNTPLYVVDGVPTQNISDINPNDVASMQVLKDAGAASIYGSRASNGVIIITTKKGSGKIKVQYDAYYGVQYPKGGNVWHVLNPQEMANLQWNAFNNSNIKPGNELYGYGTSPVLPDYIMPVGKMEGDPLTDPSLYNVDPGYSNTNEFDNFYRIVKANKSGTDWYHKIFESAPINNQSISVSGGGEQGNYLFSLNYFSDYGTLVYTHLKRYSIRSNTQYNISKHVRVGENLEYSIVDNPTVGINSEGGAIGQSFREQTIVPVYDIMGNFGGAYTTGGQQLGNARNPLAMQYRTRDNKGISNRLLGNMFIEVDFLNHFKARSNFGGENWSSDHRGFNYPEYENSENNLTNGYYEGYSTGFNFTWTNTLTFNQIFNGVHNVKVLVGSENYKNVSRSADIGNTDYFTFDPNYTTISTGGGIPSASSLRGSDALQSYFGRLDYSYQDKYLFGATIRKDGSSKFINYTWGWFPAVSIGWRISEEKFLNRPSWLNNFIVRGSWGIMGNQLNVSSNNAFTVYGGSKGNTYYDITGSNGNLTTGLTQLSLGNPNAKWEKDINSNIGIDASLFNGKISFTVDYYQKNIKDLLYNPELPGVAGHVDRPFVNIANMKNSGFDGSFTGNFDINKDLRLSATATITTYHNQITKVSDITDYFTSDGKRFGIDIIRNQVGHPISSFYGYKIIGFWNSENEISAANKEAIQTTGNPNSVYQSDVRVGHFRYADVNEDHQITSEDRTFLGDPNPDFSYGINLSLVYKNFDLSLFFYGVQGNQIWNQTKWWTDFYNTLGPGAKSYTALYDSWTPDDHNAKVAIQEKDASFGTSLVPNSYYVENGNYLRAKNVQVGYTFLDNTLNKVGINSLRIYFQAANFFTITNYSGIDPEVTGSSVSFGIDEGNYAPPRQWLFGVNAQF